MKSRVAVAGAKLDPAGMREELGVQDRGSRGAADGVVSERIELPVEHGAGAKPAEGHAHARGAVHVQARLRPVVLLPPLVGLAGGGRKALATQRREAGSAAGLRLSDGVTVGF